MGSKMKSLILLPTWLIVFVMSFMIFPKPSFKASPGENGFCSVLLKISMNPETKQLTYRITDWESDHCGSECESGNVYTTPGYGFLCVPRRIPEQLLSIQYYKYEESDAFLDL